MCLLCVKIFLIYLCLINSTSSESVDTVKHKIIDSFPFNGEPMGFLRLGYLMDVIDHFILIEANSTHSGAPKPLMFVDKYREELVRLNTTGKITIHKIAFKDINNEDSWTREQYQRDVVKAIVLNMMGNQSFILIVSDADELLRKELVTVLPNEYNDTGLNTTIKYQTKGRHFVIQLFTYSFKFINRHNWDQGYVINDIALRALGSETLSDLRTDSVRPRFLPDAWRDAGWHCTFCFKAQDVARKIKSFAHQEYNSASILRKEWIETRMREGKDVLNRTEDVYTTYDGSRGYPHCELCKTLPGYKVLKIPDIIDGKVKVN
eukprot:gene11328-23712_t